jgi:hypothetical protein
MMGPISMGEMKRQLLMHEARRWVGVEEQGGNNRGQLVEIFQSSMGRAAQEPWCMAFAQWCLAAVDGVVDDVLAGVLGQSSSHTQLIKSELCLAVWDKAPPESKSALPLPGYLVIWRHGVTTAGHTGIVTHVSTTGDSFETIEGNTSSGIGVSRDGDGIYARTRSMSGAGEMKVAGFLNPWKES